MLQRVCVALLATGCASVSHYVETDRLGDACIMVRDDAELRASTIPLIRGSLHERVGIRITMSEVATEHELPDDIRVVRIEAHVQSLPRGGRVQILFPYTDGRPNEHLIARIADEEWNPPEGQEMPVPDLHRRSDYEPATAPPRLRYTSARPEPLARRVDNEVRGWLSLFTLGAVRRHPRARNLTPQSVRALERWRRDNQRHHDEWDREQTRLVEASREVRDRAIAHNETVAEARRAHVERVSAATRWLNERRAWRCDPVGGDELMSAGATCSATVPMRWKSAPISLRVEGTIQLHDSDYRACREPLRWTTPQVDSTETLVRTFGDGAMLGEVATLETPE